MEKNFKRITISVVLAVAVYAGVMFFGDLYGLWERLSGFPLKVFFWACLLACGNYLLRFFKWQFYLKYLDICVPWPTSLGVFLSGFSMSVTPGKIGEVLKSYLLKCHEGISMTKTAPVVVAERVTDLVAILLLTLAGVSQFPAARLLVAVGGGLVLLVIVALSWERFCLWILRGISRLPKMERMAHKMEEFYRGMEALVKPWPLFVGGMLSLFAWTLEAVAFYLVIEAFPGTKGDLFVAIFIYSFSTAAGALSFLPGGLGVTEGGMIALLMETVEGVTKSIAAAATLLVRLATLWLAVAIGFCSFAWMRRKVGGSFSLEDGVLDAEANEEQQK